MSSASRRRRCRYCNEFSGAVTGEAKKAPSPAENLDGEALRAVDLRGDGGDALRAQCETLLKKAEARIEKIALDAQGKPTGMTPLDAE
jgi:hypothetical protein